jgi:metal-responsive CopG/Arc/MetJ family transcriptional regulator
VLLIEGTEMPKKVLVALPGGLLEQVDFVAQVEHRSRSDLIREALRRYIENFKRSQSPKMSVSTVGSQKVALLTDPES